MSITDERFKLIEEEVVVVGVPSGGAGTGGGTTVAAGEGVAIDTTTPGVSEVSVLLDPAMGNQASLSPAGLFVTASPAELPPFTVADAGKVLTVAPDGTLMWG